MIIYEFAVSANRVVHACMHLFVLVRENLLIINYHLGSLKHVGKCTKLACRRALSNHSESENASLRQIVVGLT